MATQQNRPPLNKNEGCLSARERWAIMLMDSYNRWLKNKKEHSSILMKEFLGWDDASFEAWIDTLDTAMKKLTGPKA